MLVEMCHMGGAGEPGSPACPGKPPNPVLPFCPSGPGGPLGPGGPVGPCRPVFPEGPCQPGMPCEPVRPELPIGPFGPWEPGGPATPLIKNPRWSCSLRRSNACMESRISLVTLSPSLGHCSLGNWIISTTTTSFKNKRNRKFAIKAGTLTTTEALSNKEELLIKA